MKTLTFIVAGIMLLVLSIFVFTWFKDAQEAKKELKASTKLEENVLGTIVSSEKNIQEAQALLTKNDTSVADQEKAKSLIDNAVADARKAAEQQPDNPRTWYYLSETYQKLIAVNPKAIQLAIDALNKAIPLAPKDGNLLNERATLYIRQQKFKEAETDLQVALKLDPDNANYFYKLGNIYRSTGKLKEAKSYYLIAKRLTPKESTVNNAQIDHQLKLLEKGTNATPSGILKKKP